MSDASTVTGQQAQAPTTTATPPATPTPQAPAGQTFSQADVDRIVAERLGRQKAQYADYDDLKAKATAGATLETRIADLEQNGRAAEQRALRAEIAAEFGISTKKGSKGEASDAELFLTGTDETTLRAQAARLSTQAAERKKQGNVAPNEGGTTTSGKADEPLREFARELFGRTD